MPEQLQHLLKRIRTEAVDQAEQEAEEILSQARTRAATLVDEAKQKSQSILAEADTEAGLFTERSSRALDQADLALKLDPNHPAGHLALANALLFETDPERIHHSCKRGVSLIWRDAFLRWLFGCVE